ncbi:creatinine amidohydrolase [Paenibacillus baekrokdamisoli]|uniref:Creatinine amidohydrolase n=1 Tax=Paenibacillus baekrokdamisoli TaxID=1712516 RepID=A0A3G9J113_9BACL|nr:creatininase family protein [Paenibacillus baekrokdamisoli]MBB3071786.1 creatinine amidohydrolase [Paenibacillus baekrokdamisoli]BBH24232.1 creatinine amidohydrolase [Paenibacillus baekrokdamisoli]
MREWMLHELTREDITNKARSGYAVVVPLAATEQHGPHLPVYTDSLICEHITTEAISKAADQVPILMAPVLTIGCSQHHLSFGGTLSFTSSTYLQVLKDIGESLITDGFTKIIFLNAHGGNEPIMIQTANDLAVRHPIWVASASYWHLASAALKEMGAAEIGMVPGHAGGFETAAVLALAPEQVRQDRIQTTHTEREWITKGRPGTFIGKHRELTGVDGYTDAPYKATAEAGRKYLSCIVDCVAEWLITTVQAMEKGSVE